MTGPHRRTRHTTADLEGVAPEASGLRPAPVTERVFAPGRRALTAGLVLTVTLVGFESLAVSTALPDISAELGGLQWYGLVFTAYMLGSLLGITVAGQRAVDDVKFLRLRVASDAEDFVLVPLEVPVSAGQKIDHRVTRTP